MKTFAAFIICLSFCARVDSFVSSTQLFDSFGDVCCEDEKAHLDNFAVTLQQQPETIGYIIFYGGKTHNFPSCRISHQRLPRHGEAQGRAARLRPYLVKTRAVDSARVVVIDGGYREAWTAELWIVPKGARPPAPTPTVRPQDIHYRKGRIRKRDYACEV